MLVFVFFGGGGRVACAWRAEKLASGAAEMTTKTALTFHATGVVCRLRHLHLPRHPTLLMVSKIQPVKIFILWFHDAVRVTMAGKKSRTDGDCFWGGWFVTMR